MMMDMKLFSKVFMSGRKISSEMKMVMILGMKIRVIFWICVRVWNSVIVIFMVRLVIMIGVDMVSISQIVFWVQLRILGLVIVCVFFVVGELIKVNYFYDFLNFVKKELILVNMGNICYDYL